MKLCFLFLCLLKENSAKYTSMLVSLNKVKLFRMILLMYMVNILICLEFCLWETPWERIIKVQKIEDKTKLIWKALTNVISIWGDVR